MTKGECFNFFYYKQKMTEETYYQRSRYVVLNRTKDYYKNDKERLRQQARDKYRNLSEEEKNKKRKHGRNRYHSIPEEIKQKLKEYQKNLPWSQKGLNFCAVF